MNTNVELKSAWIQLKEKNPKLRIKDAAIKLKVSEVQLVQCIEDSILLNIKWATLFKELEKFGYVMALTRNESVVHEKKGEYHNIKFNNHVGLVLDPNIDLRIFHKRLAYAFAVPVQTPRGILPSVQLFDDYGVAVHKVYIINDDSTQVYNDFVEKYSVDKDVEITTKKGKKPYDYKIRNGIHADSFLNDWAELKDTHDFFPLIKKYKVHRTTALEIAEGRFTTKVDNSTTERMLMLASEKQVSIMVFVSSGSVIQIHTGTVNKIMKKGDWLNVLDSEFNLHLREDHIAHSWIVQKPTIDGVVTSLEIFDQDGNSIVSFFGERKPGKPELQGWKNIINEISSEKVSL